MIQIATTQAAFEAIASAIPLGSVAFEPQVNERGERLIWLDRVVIDRLRTTRGTGRSYSDLILGAGRDGAEAIRSPLLSLILLACVAPRTPGP
jgi:hypothetical protein